MALLALAALVVGGFLLVRGESDTAESPADTSTPTAPTSTQTDDSTAPTVSVAPATYGTGRCAPDKKPAEPRREFGDAPRQCIDPEVALNAVVETNRGTFTIALDSGASPITVNNFVNLARWGYYDGTECHRVIAEFVVQCGRPGDDESAPGYSIPDELPVEGAYAEGVVAMANTGAPDTGGGQWFVITGADGEALPPTYSVVGRVTKGYKSTVTRLEALADPTAPNGTPPSKRIRILSVRIVER